MADIEKPNDSILQFLIDPRFRLFAKGRFSNGGQLEIRFKRRTKDVLELSTSEWAVLALLMKAGEKSATSDRKSGFMLTGILAKELRRLAHRGSGSPEDVHRVIHRLRKILDGTSAAQLPAALDTNGISWGKRMIEKSRSLGYRLNLKPFQIRLTVLDDEDEDDPTDSM